MKNLHLASNIGRLLAVSALSVVSAMSFASVSNAQTTDNQIINVNLTGLLQITAPNDVTIIIDPNAIIPGNLTQDIGNVNVRSNQKNGYRISVSSAQNSELRDGAGSILPYTLSANLISGDPAIGTPSNIVAPDADGELFYTSKDFQNEKCAQQVGCNVNVDININTTNILDLPGGITLTDTITYTVLAQ